MVRFKNRWLVAQILFESDELICSFTANEISSAIREKIQMLFGDVGVGNFGSSAVIFYDSVFNVFVFRTTRDALNDAWFSISCTSTIRKVPMVIRVLNTAGSARTCTQYLEQLYARTPFPSIDGVKEEDLERKKSSIILQFRQID